MEYQGPAQLGGEEHATEAVVKIADVEEPNWTGVVLESGDGEIPHTEFPVRLLAGIYEDWTATAIVTQGAGFEPILEARGPLVPPVGA